MKHTRYTVLEDSDWLMPYVYCCVCKQAADSSFKVSPYRLSCSLFTFPIWQSSYFNQKKSCLQVVQWCLSNEASTCLLLAGLAVQFAVCRWMSLMIWLPENTSGLCLTASYLSSHQQLPIPNFFILNLMRFSTLDWRSVGLPLILFYQEFS